MKNLLIRLQTSHNTKHRRSVITRKICIEFRVLKVTRKTSWSMFNTCLHYIFKVENFSIKVVLNKKIRPKKYDTGERLCSQRNIFIPQENVNIGGWKTFPFHLVKTSICLSLSARLFITIKSFFSKIFSLISILVYFCMRVSKEFKTISSEKYN